jgi:folate-binding Fe-S cluster repair protein YgfZ
LPAAGTPVEFSGRVVGFIGTAAHHHELGPIALAVLKRTLGPDDQLSAAGDPIRIDRADAPSSQPRA